MIKIEAPKSTPFQDLLLEHDAFLGFTEEYLGHRTVNKDFQVDDAVLSDFKQYLAAQNYDYTPQELDANLDWVKMNVKASIFATQFGLTSELKTRADWDPEVQQALGLMPQAAQLEQKVQQVLAQKEAALNKGPVLAIIAERDSFPRAGSHKLPALSLLLLGLLPSTPVRPLQLFPVPAL